MEDYTDYHRYSWSAIKPPLNPLVALLYRVPGYLIFLTLVYFTYTTKIFPELNRDAQLFVASVVTIISLGIVFVIHLMLDRIDRSRGPQLIDYRINKLGIHVGKKTYPHSKNLDLRYPDEETQKKAETALKYYQSI